MPSKFTIAFPFLRLLIFFLAIIFLITVIRAYSFIPANNLNFFHLNVMVDFFKKSVINYFLVGPLLFSSIVEGNSFLFIPNISLESASYFFSGFDYLISMVIKAFFHYDIVNAGYVLNRFTDSELPIMSSLNVSTVLPNYLPSILGSSKVHSSNLDFYNSFYTILFEPFIAFGLFGVIFLGLVLGYLLNFYLVKYKNTSCDFALLNLVYIFIILITSIFGNALGSPVLWLYLFSLPLIRKKLFI